jgi:triosephosphate isomerase
VVGKALLGSPVALGAQNLCPETEGAFTGEVSPAMLVDLDCRYVILGHSERRHKPELDESDAFISRKVRAAPAAGLPVILCVGETLEEREAGRMERVLEAQLAGSLANLDPSHMAQVVLAYEPVWAIGTGPYGEFIRPTWKWPAGLGLRTSARCLFRPMDESFPTPDTSDFPGRASGEL